jgi:Immunity protein 50
VQTPPFLAGAAAVVAEFDGEWPSFHDAEVLRFGLERESAECEGVVATLSVQMRRYESRNVGTVDYHQALVKSVLIDFRFTDVEDISVSDFNRQNVIDDIAFSGGGAGAAISVQVDGIYGFDGSWRCRGVEVVSVSRGPGEA